MTFEKEQFVMDLTDCVLVLLTNSNKTDILSQCRTGTDWACFWASLPDQAEKKILKIKDFIKDFT